MHRGVIRVFLSLVAVLLLVGCAPSAPTVAPTAAQATQPTPVVAPVQPTSAAAAAPTTAAPAAQMTAQPSAGVTITDDAGRKVTVKSAQKIVSLSPSNTEILFALGLGDRVVGDTDYCDYPEAAKTKPKVGGFATIDVEKVASLAPDLVIAGSLHVPKVVPALEKLGLTVVVVEPATVDDVFARMVTIGQLTGKEKEAADLKATLEKRLGEITAKAKADKSTPRVFWMIGDGLFTAGPGSFIGDVIAKANGTNIAADAKTQWPELSMEAILKADPEVIVVAAPEGDTLVAKVKADPAWQSVTAVKNNRFVVVDQNVVSRAAPRIVDAVELIAKGLHPEQFK